jgi:general secretion pathway protein G
MVRTKVRGEQTATMRRNAGFTLIELMIVIAIIAILAGILIPNFVRARAQSLCTACKQNLANIGKAFEMYATDNGGEYPTSPVGVIPNYLSKIPTCPSSGVDYQIGVNPPPENNYTLVCRGSGHSGVDYPDNFPQYTARAGLVLP